MQTGHCSSGNKGIGGGVVDVSSEMMDISGPVKADVIKAVVVSGPLCGLLGSPDMFWRGGRQETKGGGGSMGWSFFILVEHFSGMLLQVQPQFED